MGPSQFIILYTSLVERMETVLGDFTFVAATAILVRYSKIAKRLRGGAFVIRCCT